MSQRRNEVIIDYVRARIEKPERIYGKGYGEEIANNEGQKDYQLVVGSYSDPKNNIKLTSKLNQLGFELKQEAYEKFTRIIVTTSDRFDVLIDLQEQLKQDGIESWITQSSCYQLSEEIHQTNRRTDFKVIQL